MGKNQISFFSTKNDLIPILNVLEEEVQLSYCKTGIYSEPQVEVFQSMVLNSMLGTASIGDAIQCASYLVVRREFPFVVREVPQREGGIKYFLDQLLNPKSVSFRPAGVFGSMNIIQGQVGTVSNDSDSIELYKRFVGHFKKRFSKIKAAYVGSEAELLLAKGWRLTVNVKSPDIYDLKR